MESNPMRKIMMYKGCVVEYTGIPDDENPIGLYFDSVRDAQHILISASISPFLMEAIAEAILNEDNEALKNILEKSGLKKPKAQFTAKMEMDLFEICAKNKVQL